MAVLTLVASGCGNDDDAADPVDPTPVDPGEPVRGGTLTMAMFSEASGLDPIGASGSGVAGGTEMMALYDTIMQWNEETLSFDTRTAESLVHNEDYTVWTLTLRDGITFRDGTPYDAQAVALSFERHKSPQNVRNTSRAWLAPVESWEVLDELTIEFRLGSPWPGFPYALAREPGMLVSPTAIEALGDPDAAGWMDRFEEHNRNPVGTGAGPFELVEFRPREVIVLRKDPDYWKGEPHLDELRFVVLPGAAATVDALETGDIDVGYIRSVDQAHRARQLGFDGIEWVASGGDLLLINNGLTVVCRDGEPAPHCTGQPDGSEVTPETPGTSLTVRRAIAHAIDPDVIDRRVYDGVGLTGSDLFHESFPWDPGVPGPEYDPELAARLVEEAKAEGWDGRIRLVSTRTPERVALALALESLLQTVGIEVDMRADLEVVDHITLIIQRRDFDLSAWGLTLVPDESAVTALVQNWLSTSPTNRGGYRSERMDAAILATREAATFEEKVAAFGQVAEIYAEEIPSVVLGAVSEFVAWRGNVHGLTPNAHLTVLLDEAWIDR